MSNKLKVLLTRSIEENKDIIELIKSTNITSFSKFRFINCPLIEYKDLEFNIKTNLSNFDQFIITSKHAAKLVAQELSKIRKTVLFWVVGKFSAEILKNAGGIIKFIADNVNDLINYIPIQEYKKIIYLSGKYITMEFPEDIKRVNIYDTIYRQDLKDIEINEIKNGLDYILIFSANTAKVLTDLFIKYNLIEITAPTKIIAISKKIEIIIKLYFNNITCCKEGQHDQMIKILIEDARY